MLKYVELAGRELGSARGKTVCFSAAERQTLLEQACFESSQIGGRVFPETALLPTGCSRSSATGVIFAIQLFFALSLRVGYNRANCCYGLLVTYGTTVIFQSRAYITAKGVQHEA